MLARLICLAALLFLPAAAIAQPKGETPPGPCLPKNWEEITSWREWLSHTPPENAKRWEGEAPRIGNKAEVWRYLDRLYLGLAGGKVVTLTDCPLGDNLRFFVYERYDEPGDFHVVGNLYYEDHSYALIMRKTGLMFTIPAVPVWSPDRTRFAYGVCDLMNAKDDIAIMKPSGNGLQTETAGHMPCGMGNCALTWENATTLAAVCTESADQGGKRQVMRLTWRDNKWTSATGPR